MRKPDICFAYVKTKTQISCAVTAQLISAFIFTTQIVQFLLYPKFQDSNFFLRMYRPVCVRPGQTGFLASQLNLRHLCGPIGRFVSDMVTTCKSRFSSDSSELKTSLLI